MRKLLLALVLLAFLGGILAVPASAAVNPLLLSVDGPLALAPSQTAVYNVSAFGGPTGNVSYTVVYYIIGGNTTGGSPLSSSPGRASGNHSIFKINVTAPSSEQTLSLVVTVDATPEGGSAQNVTRTLSIAVVKAIVLSATFHNGGTTAAVNITVRWFIDGAAVGTTQIAQISANADSTATFDYLPVGLAPGPHTLRVEADLDRNGVVEPSRGEVVTSTIFYSQVQPIATGWTILLGMGIFIPVFIGVVALRRRGQR